MNPVVTIAIALYNNAAYVKRCVESVLSQTYQSLEIIIVNDGSTDNSLQECACYKSMPSVVIIDKPNGGLSSTRQTALDAATGEYICFIDADDYLLPTHVENMLKKMREENSDICICSTRFEDAEGNELAKQSERMRIIEVPPYQVQIVKKPGNKKVERPAMHLSDSWNKMYRLPFLRQSQVDFKMPKGMNGTDTSFNSRLFFHEPVFSSVGAVGYVHVVYQKTGSATQRKEKNLIDSFQIIINQLIEESEIMGFATESELRIRRTYNEYLRYAYQDVYCESDSLWDCYRRFNVIKKKDKEFCQAHQIGQLKIKEAVSRPFKTFIFIKKYTWFLLPLFFKIRARKLSIGKK